MEAEISGHVYRAGRLDAFKALDVARRYSSILFALATIKPKVDDDGKPLATEVPISAYATALPLYSAKASQDDSDFVTSNLLAVLERQQPGGVGWAKVREPATGRLMFADIGPKQIFELMVFSLKENGLLDFFAVPLSEGDSPKTAS